jgi:hypothetical protein
MDFRLFMPPQVGLDFTKAREALANGLSDTQQPVPGINIPAVQASTPAPGVPGFQGVQKAQLIPSVPADQAKASSRRVRS